MTDELPPGWARARIGDIARFVRGVTYSKEHSAKSAAPGLTAVLRANNIGRGLNFDDLVFVPDRFVDDEQIVRNGDVVLAMSSGSKSVVGKAAVAKSPPRCGFGAFCGVIRPSSQISPAMLGYFFQTKAYRNAVSEASKGVNINNLKAEHILSRPLLVAPRAEQERIASKVDELFSRIDDGERALERVEKLVERYRQSVLKAAVTGELTREWREKNKAKLESGEALLARILKVRREVWEKAELKTMKAKGSTPSDNNWKDRYGLAPSLQVLDLPEPPEGWSWATVEQCGDVKLGRQRAPQHHSGEHMRPYLRVANVYEDRLDLQDVKEMNFTPEEFKTYALQPHDILLNEGQSPELVGRPAMYRGEIPGCCYQKTLIRFRARQGVLPDFALCVFRFYLHSGRFRRSANITTSIAHLAAERFVAIEFPVPSLEEQQQIVDRVATNLGRVEHLAGELRASRKSTAGLRQAVLASAFSGDLVAQDPSDEPAIELLSRTAAARTHNAGTSRGSRMKSTA